MSLPTRVRIAAYNVLAQSLATSSFFPYAGSALKAKTRVPRLLARVDALDADVICLSESFVDVLDGLAAKGYDVSLARNRDGRNYGVAIAFRAATLELVGSAGASFDDVAEALLDGDGGAAAATGGGEDRPFDARPPSTYRTASLALFATLSVRETRATFSVATTHLFWDPKLEVVKAAQAVMLTEAAGEFAAAHAPTAPFFVCGDFNSMPGSWTCDVLQAAGGFAPAADASVDAAARVAGWDVYQRGAALDAPASVAWRARLRAALDARLGLPIAGPGRGSAGDAAGTGRTLRSAYAASEGGECDVTTVTATFAATIDFVFTCGTARLLGVLPLPQRHACGGPMPSASEPSDHLPLACDFEII